MPADLRLTQLTRILGLDPAGVSLDSAPQVVESRARELAAAFFAEAAANDDVTDADSARSYLELRLSAFGELVPEAAAAAIRAAFEARLAAWG